MLVHVFVKESTSVYSANKSPAQKEINVSIVQRCNYFSYLVICSKNNSYLCNTRFQFLIASPVAVSAASTARD